MSEGIAKWRAVSDQYKEIENLVAHYHAAGDIDHVISVEPAVHEKLVALRDSIQAIVEE